MEDKGKSASSGTISVPTTSASSVAAAQTSAKQMEECQSGERKETAVETDSKEPTKPLASKEDVTNSKDPPNDACKEVGSEKRSRETLEDDGSDESAKKKTKREELATSAASSNSNSSSNSPSMNSKPSRGTRGSLSERADKGSKTSKRSNSAASEKKGSPPSSATNSPKKPGSRDHSDEEDSENGRKSAELKVPPLKIVLSGSGQSGNGGSDDKKSPVGASKEDAKETEKQSPKDGTDLAENTNQSSSTLEGLEDNDSKGASGNSHNSGHGTRLTRSRANQGTPGPSEQGSDSPRDLSQCENANLEPPTKEVSVPTSSTSVASSNVNQQSCQQASSNLNYADYHVKKRKLRSQVDEASANNGSNLSTTAANSSSANGDPRTSNGGGPSKSSSSVGGTTNNEPLNDIEKYLNIRKQVEQRRKNLFPVQPKPPQGFKDYLMNRKTYLLQGNAHERLRSIPMIQPPHSLDGPLRELFKQQEEERYKLRLKHVVEKEKLVLAVEQEILRVHGRAARALANQSLPYSVCTILKDEEIFTPIDPHQEEKNRDIRSRYNGRLFLSWLQDVDDKWEKIKEQMVLRHHNEAESLNAVQKMDWEWKVNEITGGTSGESVPLMDDLHIPMVHVSDDFDMSIS